MRNLLYIAHGSNDFADDMHFIGLQKFLSSFNIYYTMSDSQFGKPDCPENRHIEYPWRQSWLNAAALYTPVDHNILYDVCIIGQIWEQNQQEFFNLRHLLKPDAKVILIDSTDDGGPKMPIHIDGDFNYFKNNIYGNFNTSGYIPFSCPYEILDLENNKSIEYEINCQLGNTHPSRHLTTQAVLDIALELGIADKSLIGLFSGGSAIIGSDIRTPTNEYWDVIDKSRIIIHERGCGFDAFRFWEALATGNFVLCSPLNLFEANEVPLPDNVMFWKNHDHLKELIKYALSVSESQMFSMRNRSKEFSRTHHAPHRRLEKIFNNSGITY